MVRIRALAGCVLVAVMLFVASAVSAQQVYSMSGRLISNRGSFIQIPLVGGAAGNCDNFRWGHVRGPRGTAITFKGTGMLLKSSVAITKEVAAPFGCAEGLGKITATQKGVGKRFTIPAPAGATTAMGIAGAFFNRPLPGGAVVVSVPDEQKFVQLATSFRIDAPPKAIPATGVEAPMGALLSKVGGKIAPFRRFQKSAWQGGPGMTDNGQTGRAGPNFTWCFGNGNCQTVAQGTGALGRMIVKYHGGPNRFGGTMAYVISVGPNKSSLALALQPNGAVAFLVLAGMGQQPTGRGYADRLIDKLNTGPIYAMYQTMSGKITMVSTRLNPLAMSTKTALINSNYGFPFTTGSVLARATGSTPGPAKSPATSTNTAMGSDRTEPLAKNGRIITLVAGGIARTSEGSNTPEIGFLPEPGRGLEQLAGGLVLIGIAASRGRRDERC